MWHGHLNGDPFVEFGIRLALGARPGEIVMLVLRQGMFLVLTDIGLGLGLAIGMTRFLSTLIYGISTTDPMTFVKLKRWY